MELKNKVTVSDSVPTVCKINVKGLVKPLRIKFTYGTAGALKIYISNEHVEPTANLCEKRAFGRPQTITITGNEKSMTSASPSAKPASKLKPSDSNVFCQEYVYMTLIIATESVTAFSLMVEAFAYKEKKNVFKVTNKSSDLDVLAPMD